MLSAAAFSIVVACTVVITVAFLGQSYLLPPAAFALGAVSALACGAIVVAARLERARSRFYAALTREMESQHETTELPIVEEMPGWKVAEVFGPLPTLTGLLGEPYEVSDAMRCLETYNHYRPELSCSCGFHAFYEQSRAERTWRQYAHGVLLHVEGYGTVIEHDHGWRSARQEVLEVVLPSQCSWCRRPSAGLATSPRERIWRASCRRCGERRGRAFMACADLRQMWRTDVRVADRRPRLARWWRVEASRGL